MEYKSFSFTHPGHSRQVNEDAYYADDLSGLWIVCDGMGGHKEGNFASHLVTDTFEKLKLNSNFEQNVQTITKYIHHVKKHLEKKVEMLNKRTIIGTTIILLYIQEENAICIYAGDSRCYNLRDNKLSLVSKDHTKEIVEGNKFKKVLTNALFAPGEIFIDTKRFKVKKNDVFLLCSDGLYETLSNKLIKIAMKEHCFDIGMKCLTQKVLLDEANDNLTAILVGVQ